jgi:hypothetical protein
MLETYLKALKIEKGTDGFKGNEIIRSSVTLKYFTPTEHNNDDFIFKIP